MELEVENCVTCPFLRYIDEEIHFNPYCWLENSVKYLHDFTDTGIYRGSYPKTCRLLKEKINIKFLKI